MTAEGSSLCQPGDGEGELVDMKNAVFKAFIVGEEQILLDQHGPRAVQPEPLSSPPAMSAAQWAKHVLTHRPYHPGRPICVATRRPNSQHGASHNDERIIPGPVADYCFVRSSGDGALQAVLVMRLYPYKL